MNKSVRIEKIEREMGLTGGNRELRLGQLVMFTDFFMDVYDEKGKKAATENLARAEKMLGRSMAPVSPAERKKLLSDVMAAQRKRSAR